MKCLDIDTICVFYLDVETSVPCIDERENMVHEYLQVLQLKKSLTNTVTLAKDTNRLVMFIIA